MVDLVICEFLKLKRNKMFLISIFASLAAPFICLVGLIRARANNEIGSFAGMFGNCLLYTFLLVGFLIYSVMAAYLFSREQSENTLKTIITLPVSKNKYLIGKFIAFFLWMIFLSILSWFATLLFSFLGGAIEPSVIIIFQSLLKFIIGTVIICFTIIPLIFVTLWHKNIVPPMIVAVVITMINVVLSNESWSMLFPWSALLTIVLRENFIYPDFPMYIPYLVIIITGIGGILSCFIYFNKHDIK